jgi:hypothetical protein
MSPYKNNTWYSNYFNVRACEWGTLPEAEKVLDTFRAKYGNDSYGKKYFLKLHNMNKKQYAVFTRKYTREKA